MTDDPREILKAAGVECAEVEKYESPEVQSTTASGLMRDHADSAILALARLVAKSSWQVGYVCSRLDMVRAYGKAPWYSRKDMQADLDRRWKEHNA